MHWEKAQIVTPEARCMVVVPCYNEEARLQPRQFSEFLAEDNRVNFLFVNDGSIDGTLRILETLRAKHPDRIEVWTSNEWGQGGSSARAGC